MKKYIDIYEEKYKEWSKKVLKNDPLRLPKKEALECAVFLCYSDEVLEKILNAEKEWAIDNILHDARCRCA